MAFSTFELPQTEQTTILADFSFSNAELD